MSRSIEPDQRAASETAFLDIIEEQGPVIDSYPTGHPLVATHSDRDRQRPSTTPDRKCGYTGLGHTVYFANGFVTCPCGDGQEVMDAVEKLPLHPIARITAERLDAQLYHPGTTAVLVRCEWDKPLPTEKWARRGRRCCRASWDARTDVDPHCS